MSYSFSTRGATAEEVLANVAAELDKVVLSQPLHSHDKDQALAAAKAFVEILPAADGHDIHVSMHGSIGWSQGSSESEMHVTSAGVGVSASLTPSEKAATPGTDPGQAAG